MKNKSQKQIIGLILLGYISLIIGGGIAIYYSYLNESKKRITEVTARIQDDIQYANGTWNTFLYNSDPQLPAGEPLYIIATDGYIIDRWRPIHGFLDVTDFKNLLNFQNPQTFTLNSDQKWRMYSRPILSNNETIGVITLSIFNPTEEELNTIDANLKADADLLYSQINIQNNTVDISKVDIRKTHYNTAVRIVDKFNTLLIKSNNSNSIDRTPSYIDSSYIAREIRQTHFRHIRDNKTHEPYLVRSTKILNNNEPIGVIIVGSSLKTLYNQLYTYIISQSIVVPVVSVLSWLMMNRFIIAPKQVINIKRMSFQKKENSIYIDDEKIEIPHDTHQYHLAEVIFSNPRKKWDASEIAKKFDESNDNISRKVYDAMILLNKRVEPILRNKLIIVKDRYFQLNPDLISFLD